MPPGSDDALAGVWNIVPTPFTASAELDLAGVARLTEFVIRTGVDGLTILGVMGEAPKLSDAERTAIIEATIAAAAGRRPVCVGVSHAATDRAVAFAREAQARGAHSVMLAPPQLAKPSDSAIRFLCSRVSEGQCSTTRMSASPLPRSKRPSKPSSTASSGAFKRSRKTR